MTPFETNNRILFVDDEEHVLASFSSLFRKESVRVTTLSSPLDVAGLLQDQGPFAVVLSDQRMPGMDGVAVLELVAREHPDTVRVLMTGFANHADTVRAVNSAGIRHYVPKPWDDDALRALIREGIRSYNLQVQNAQLLEELKEKNESLKELLQGTLGGTTRILSEIVGHANAEAAAQVERVRKAGRVVLGMLPDVSSAERWEATRAFDLFNLGIALLPSWILVVLNKHGLASAERFPLAASHHLAAADLLREIPRFEGVARILRLMHRNQDGSGDPPGEHARGNDIPLGARILHILLDLDRQSTSTFRGRPVLQQMARHPERYDTAIIRVLLDGRTRAGEWEERTIALAADLTPGMVLLEDLSDRSGQVLLRTGFVLSESALIMVRRWSSSGNLRLPVRVRVDG